MARLFLLAVGYARVYHTASRLHEHVLSSGVEVDGELSFGHPLMASAVCRCSVSEEEYKSAFLLNTALQFIPNPNTDAWLRVMASALGKSCPEVSTACLASVSTT